MEWSLHGNSIVFMVDDCHGFLTELCDVMSNTLYLSSSCVCNAQFQYVYKLPYPIFILRVLFGLFDWEKISYHVDSRTEKYK